MTEPRTILYVSNTTKPWCTEVHVTASLRSLGHTVINLQESELVWGDVPRLAEEHGAHMLLWTRTWPAEMAEVVPALEHFRDKGIPTVSYHLDRWFGLDREHQVRDQPFFHTALVVSPDDSPRWVDEGVNHLWMPPGVYDAECEPVPPDRQTYPHDVVFVGSYPYPHPEWSDYRRALIETMQRRFGRRFQVWPIPRRPLRGRDLQTLYASAKVVIGDSCLAGESYLYWSDRIPETLGRGGLLIHPFVSGGVAEGGFYGALPAGGYTAGSDAEASAIDSADLLGYNLHDFERAANAAEWALDRPEAAAAIAEHGRATVLGRDTYRHRMEALLVEVERQFGWNDGEATDREAVCASTPEALTSPLPRLEIGSGSFPTEGFTHLDINPDAPDVDIVGPMFPLDLPDASVSEIRAVDCLEHCSFRDTATALREWARVLRPGGRIYVQVPDADLIMRWFVNEPSRLLDRLPADLPQTPLAGATWRLLGGHADGVQGAGDVDFRLNAHYAMFSWGSLREAMETAGFEVTEIIVNEHPNLCARAVKR